MIRLLLDEFHDGLERRIAEKQSGAGLPWEGTREISLATGKLAFPYLKRMSEEVMQEYPGLQMHLYEIVNEFFGEMITVSGLSVSYTHLFLANVPDMHRNGIVCPYGTRMP